MGTDARIKYAVPTLIHVPGLPVQIESRGMHCKKPTRIRAMPYAMTTTETMVVRSLSPIEGKIRRYSVITESFASVMATQHVVMAVMKSLMNLSELDVQWSKTNPPERTPGCS